jgi:hypothetical protein
MSEINYKLLTDIIFMNDTTFTDIDIKNAKIIAHTCKLAKFNKNIQLSFDNFKIDKYYKQVIYLSEKKTVRHIEKYEIPLDVQLGAMDLDINIKYKEKIYNIIINLLKENVYVIEGVKEKMLIEQINNIEKFNSKIKIIFDIIYKIAIDINNITYDDNDLIENDIEHYEIKTNIANIMTIFKYNSYFINMLSINLVNEKAVIDFISSEYFAKNWFKIPIIFPKSSLNLLNML